MLHPNGPQPPAPPQLEWKVWQLIDSAFPAGGFAHSSGIEAAWQAGWIRCSADAETFIDEALEQAVHGGLAFVAAAIGDGDVAALDARLNTYLVNHVANRASRLQGAAFVATAAAAFDLAELRAFRKQVVRSELYGHLPVAFGVVAQVLGLSVETAQRMFLYMTLRGVLSAAVRLGIFGPLEAQRLQARMGARLEELMHAARLLTLDDVCQTSPLLELWQMGQDRLYSRLFQS
jgi:urease accessory protein